jgi:deazaflavin-dependent oxidoreductase (nitroreductase family)
LTDPRTFRAKVIEEFRANGGRVSLREDDRFVIVASNGGSSTHPAWYHNLKANPRIKVELGAQTFTAVADELEGPARAEVWPMLVAEAPKVAEFQSRVVRSIPVFTLTRQD